MSRVPPGVGETPYQLAGAGAYWSRRGAVALGRLLGRLLPERSDRATRVTVRVRRVSELNPLARLAIRLWLAWVHTWQTRWADFDWYVSVHIGGRIVSIAGVVDRLGTVGDTPTRLGLLGGVFTVPEHRGRGLARDVVKRSTRLMADALGCEYGVLICADPLVPFYERLGWKRAGNTLRFERFGRPGTANSNVMVYECAGRPISPGAIDVRGLPA